jgi:hypothetical protein
MSLIGKDNPRKPAEFTPWVATPAESQPELRERFIGDQLRQARRSAGLTQLELVRTLKIALSKLSLRARAGHDAPACAPDQHCPEACRWTQSAAGRPEVITAT